MQQINKPFAPFGAVFFQLKQCNLQLSFTPYLFCGKDAVRECRAMLKKGMLALCVPPGKDFNDYRWDLSGLQVIIFNTGSMSELGLIKLAHGVLKQGAHVVGVYSEDSALRLHKLKKELNR